MSGRVLCKASIKARFGGLLFAIRRFSGQQFWGGHPNTFRGFFAWASLSFAYELWIEDRAFAAHGYELMRLVAPPHMWALAFLVHFLAISAGVLRGTSVRVPVQLFVNGYGILIWAVYIVLQDLAFGHQAINSSAERVMVLYGLWAFVRTGMNRWSDHR